MGCSGGAHSHSFMRFAGWALFSAKHHFFSLSNRDMLKWHQFLLSQSQTIMFCLRSEWERVTNVHAE